MEVQVNLESTAINDAICKAVVESRLGEAIRKEVEKFLEDKGSWGPSLNQVCQRAVEGEIRTIVLQLIHQEYGDRIRSKARELITEELLTSVISKAIQKLGY